MMLHQAGYIHIICGYNDVAPTRIYIIYRYDDVVATRIYVAEAKPISQLSVLLPSSRKLETCIRCALPQPVIISNHARALALGCIHNL